jgi:hypothetical protein
MKILTVHNPYAWAIFHAGKDVENRSRPTSYRGNLLIHSGLSQKSMDSLMPTKLIMPLGFPFGSILGSVELVDCITDSDSEWAMPGYYHWILENPVVLDRPFPIKGRLGLWTAPSFLLAFRREARAVPVFRSASGTSPA